MLARLPTDDSSGFSSSGDNELTASTAALDSKQGGFSGRQHPQVGNIVLGVFTPGLAKQSTQIGVTGRIVVKADTERHSSRVVLFREGARWVRP